MRRLAEAMLLAEETRGRIAKVTALAAALRAVGTGDPARLPFAARFVTGMLLPTSDGRPLGVGSALVLDALCAVTGETPSELAVRARRHGDLGTGACEALEADPTREVPGLSLEQVESLVDSLAGSSSRSEKLGALRGALEVATPMEARYVVRAVLGEMRIGAREGIVEEALAKAFERPLVDIRGASGLLADVGDLARLAYEDRLGDARIQLGRPVGFMLATPIETARGADLRAPHVVEDKIDGIRAQAHVTAEGVALFARGKGSVTGAFPEITRPLQDAAASGAIRRAILDGELVVVAPDGRPRPFSAIQPRLKKNAPDEELLREYPVAYLVYDLLYEGDAALLGLPFSTRRERLLGWCAKAPAPIRPSDARPLVVPDGSDPGGVLDSEFEAARARGFEGLVLKRLDAPYTAGVRGFSWLKVKKALATLDVVVVGAARGSGKRAKVLSDYTFAVRDEGELKTIGKAYSGLTDLEIAALTARFESLALEEERRGFLRVRPEVVLEIAFDGLQRSERHTSGFALRFPRIARIRDDKAPAEADDLEAVRALWREQIASGHREETQHGETRRGAEDTPGRKTPTGRRSGRRPDTRKKTKQLKLFDED